ncbi:patatin-like phospholipase family protein [Magnetospirillum sulfuroxidans]|uniref:Patatin-like phospholipase family protein n=1 Tax=Magnetospirillum sulfuroxidans TaxID=611300 RepID=A0ABS5I8M3_9PROT|nr:patatin-like phospholipase family protein [Magnetospirillum sulfuroxidans]MBR9970795.1 patatin-like phospholipase family protein [Magnetospirillum sulfuroxidans]
MKRAICLAGGGPAVGLSLGTLKRLHEEADIKFDVWSLACIGAWLGIVWNQADPGTEAEVSESFFRGIFRPDDVYDRFPIAAAFAPDYQASMGNMVSFMLDPTSYRNLVVPAAIQEAWMDILRFAGDPSQWSQANFNTLILNQVMAVNPVSRFITSLMYKSKTRGLSRIYYPNSAFLQQIDFKRLYEPGRPAIYHNAYNLTDDRLELFSNNDHKYAKISAETLCACSALPYIEEPVVIGDKTYCEGATVDTVNFEDLMRNHPDLDEIWVSRILDIKQVRKPENLYDALNNLVMLFAATTSEDDVKLFKYHAAESYPNLRIIEIPVAFNIDYDWSYSNLDRSIVEGYDAADQVLEAYRQGRELTAQEAEAVSVLPAKPRKSKVSA